MAETLATWLQWARSQARKSGVKITKQTRVNLDDGRAVIYEHVGPVAPSDTERKQLKEWKRIERAIELDAALFKKTEAVRAFNQVELLQLSLEEKLDGERFRRQVNAPSYTEEMPSHWAEYYPDPIGGTYRLNYLLTILKQAETLCKEAVLRYIPSRKDAEIYSPDRPTLLIKLRWTGSYTGL